MQLAITPRVCLAAILASTALGATLGAAIAQQDTSGQLDATCANDCASRGYDPEYCGNVCWIPAVDQARPGPPADWRCVIACRDRGGTYQDCRPRCPVS